jgi:Tol biopolymer transport system component
MKSPLSPAGRWLRRGLAVLLLIACASSLEAQRRRWRARPRSAPPPAPERVDVPPPRLITDSGGRLSWYQGSKHQLIAFDAVSDDRTKNSEVYTMNPDGSGRRCVTCDAPVPKGFVGQPAWHPDGEHIVIQVENKNSAHKYFNHMSWGVDNDLWLIKRDGSGAQKIWELTRSGQAALHPQFSDDGSLLMFAERSPTGKVIPGMRALTPGGENQWEGWRLHIASVNVNADGPKVLSNHRNLAPNGSGFYESHQITDDGRAVFSFTPGGRAYVDDIYSARLDGSDVKNLTNSPTSWDELGHYSPQGDFAFISSRFDRALIFPRARPTQLRSELFVQKRGAGAPVQMTDMNARKGRPMVVSDFDWDREGKRIAFQVAALDLTVKPEIWMIDVK